MTILPESLDQNYLANLFDETRKIYDEYKLEYGFKHLSMGMSSDYSLAIKHGSNMIRVGSKIFGNRNYGG